MKYIKGNLITLADEGLFDVIIHGCNCQNVMGVGIAKQLRIKWPAVYTVDCDESRGVGDNTIQLLGCHSYTPIRLDSGDYIRVFNAYTQHGLGRQGRQVNYAAIGASFLSIFDTLALVGVNSPTNIGIPKIGAGLAGGDWGMIETIINDANREYNHNITCVEYE